MLRVQSKDFTYRVYIKIIFTNLLNFQVIIMYSPSPIIHEHNHMIICLSPLPSLLSSMIIWLPKTLLDYMICEWPLRVGIPKGMTFVILVLETSCVFVVNAPNKLGECCTPSSSDLNLLNVFIRFISGRSLKASLKIKRER